jgi:hypothetical protein
LQSRKVPKVPPPIPNGSWERGLQSHGEASASQMCSSGRF